MYQSPDPAEIKALREIFGLTQNEAATQVHVKLRAWQWWESGDRKMPIGLWELFLIKTDHHPKFKLLHKKNAKR
jgi:DNA-binding transcriptional regulator YiaG